MKAVTGLPTSFKKMHGPRETVRTFTFSGVIARWRKDELVETLAPLLVFVLDGEADLNCADYILHVPRHYAVFVPAGVPRWTGANNEEQLGDKPERFSNNILFSERCGSLEIWLNHDRGNRHYRSKLNEVVMVQNVRLIRLLEEIQHEVTAQRTNDMAICCRLLEVFLLTLQRDLQENKAIHPGRLQTDEMMHRERHDPIKEAQQFIRDHLHEHLVQDKVARQVRLSRTQFIQRFHTETGQTFNQFVTHCRMEQAKILLQTTDFPLTFISRTIGYKSVVHFNNLFRKQVGLLPTAYRIKKRPI